MIEELLKAIIHGKPWIDSFTRFSYRDAFSQYRVQYEASFASAVVQVPSLEELAEQLVAAVEDGWKKERFWNRAAAKVNDKMMLVAYLTPLLLSSQEPLCRAFAPILCQAWNARWPENPYQVADYDAILDGFRNSIMGFDLEGKHIGR